MDIQQFRSVLRAFERELAIQNSTTCCSNITLAQCHTLLELEKHRQISITELSEKLELDKSTTSRTIESLVKKQLDNRHIDKNNRRRNTIELTAEGRKTCDDINCNNNSYLEKALHNFTNEEIQELIRLMQKITTNMTRQRLQNTYPLK